MKVTNIGGCADLTIHLDAKAKPEQGAVDMTRQLKAHLGFNCYTSTKQAGIEDLVKAAEVIEIAYSAGDWKSQ